MDISFEIELFVSIVVFGTVPYFVFVYVPVPGYEHKHTQQTPPKNIKKVFEYVCDLVPSCQKALVQKKVAQKIGHFYKNYNIW